MDLSSTLCQRLQQHFIRKKLSESYLRKAAVTSLEDNRSQSQSAAKQMPAKVREIKQSRYLCRGFLLLWFHWCDQDQLRSGPWEWTCTRYHTWGFPADRSAHWDWWRSYPTVRCYPLSTAGCSLKRVGWEQQSAVELSSTKQKRWTAADLEWSCRRCLLGSKRGWLRLWLSWWRWGEAGQVELEEPQGFIWEIKSLTQSDLHGCFQTSDPSIFRLR